MTVPGGKDVTGEKECNVAELIPSSSWISLTMAIRSKTEEEKGTVIHEYINQYLEANRIIMKSDL